MDLTDACLACWIRGSQYIVSAKRDLTRVDYNISCTRRGGGGGGGAFGM